MKNKVECDKREYSIVDYDEFENVQLGNKSQEVTASFDAYYEILSRHKEMLLNAFSNLDINKELIDEENKRIFNSFCKYIKDDYWIYGIKFDKCNMHEISKCISKFKLDIEYLWIDCEDISILLVKEKDFMIMNKILCANDCIVAKEGLKFIQKTPSSYKEFLQSNDDMCQINLFDQGEFDNILPMLLTNHINFEIYTDRFHDHGFSYVKKDEDLVLNILDKTKIFDRREKAELICKRCIDHIDRSYFIDNLVYSNENNFTLISPRNLLGYIDLAEFLNFKHFKMYYSGNEIGKI